MMNLTVQNESARAKKPAGTIILYVAVAAIALMGLAMLINNILMYTGTVAQYVEQGYPKAEVVKQLLPGQLLPGVFQSIALYGGGALLLFYVGKISETVSQYLALLRPAETGNPESVVHETVVDEAEQAEEPINVAEPVNIEEPTNITDEYNDPVNTNP